MAEVGGVKAGSPPPLLSIVVVYFNTPQVLEDCLSSLREATAGLEAETIVIDNGSDPVNQQRPHSRPGFRIIRNKFNRGYAAAANQGASAARGDYLLFLNSDAFMTAECLQGMLAAMDANPDFAAVSPMLAWADGRLQSPARRFLGPFGQAAGLLGRRSRRPLEVRGAPLTEVDWVQACALLVRTSAFRGVCGFDEGYFFYEEDEDLCWRLRRQGHRIGVAGSVSCRHVGGASTKVAGDWPLSALYAGQLRFMNRRFGRPGALIYKLAVSGALLLKVAKPGGSYTIQRLRVVLGALWMPVSGPHM